MFNKTDESQQPLKNESSNIYGAVSQPNTFNVQDNQDDGQDEQQYQQFNDPHIGQHSDIMKNYKNYYPIDIRIQNWVKSTLCCAREDTYVSKIEKTQQKITFTEEEKEIFHNKIVELVIEETTQLELDKNLLHPFVKVHIVNMKNGHYVYKQQEHEQMRTPALVSTEVRNKYEQGKWVKGFCDFVPSFATNCCDLRIHGNSKARWDHTQLLNIEANHLYQEDNIFLFEILDFNPKFLRDKDQSKLDRNNFYRVAWGFLRPIGLSGNHFGKVRVQLYKYVFNSNKLDESYQKMVQPLVYFDFIWPQKIPYKGQLQICLNAVKRPQTVRVNTAISRNVFEIEGEQASLERSQVFQQAQQIGEMEATEADKRKLRRRRKKGDKCIVPDKVLVKFPSAPLGCFRLEFSHSGKFLAAACTNENSKTFIKIFEVEDEFQEVFRYRGHQNLIHELSWFLDDSFLVSCSSDFTAKVWLIPSETNDKVTEDQSETQHLLATLIHPSYVYSAKFHPSTQEQNKLTVVTACFDAKIRIFYVPINKRGENIQDPEVSKIISSNDSHYDDYNSLLDHRHPNSLDFDEKGQLYVGDSLGTVHQFDLTTINQDIKRNQILQDISIEGDAINQIHFGRSDWLIVHSRDNCLRKFLTTYSSNKKKVQSQYIGSTTQKFPIHSRISPDKGYVLAGSEDGKPYLWDISGDSIPVQQLEYDIQGPITDVSWSETYNMVAISGFSDEFPIVLYVYESEVNYINQQYNILEENLQREEENRKNRDYDDMQQANNNRLYDPAQYLR